MRISWIILVVLILILSGCEQNINTQPKTKEGAETTADKFARAWEQKDYSTMYDMFIPELRKTKSKEEFISLLNYLEKESNIIVRLDKISMESKDIAYAYYTITSSLFDSKAPAMKMEYIKGEWEFNAFASYFAMNLEEKKFIDNLKSLVDEEKKDIEQIEFILKNKIISQGMSVCLDYLKDDETRNSQWILQMSYPLSLEEFRNSVVLFTNHSRDAEWDIISTCIQWETSDIQTKLKKYDEASKTLQEIQENLKNVDSNLEKAKTELVQIEKYIEQYPFTK